MPRRRLPLAAVLLACFAAAATAQEVRVYRDGDAVDPHDVARILEQRPMKMRSIRLLDDAPVARKAGEAGAGAAHAGPSALALLVQFAFDSAEIRPSAREQLDALAQGIRMLPAAKSVVIEGHTDAAGADAYNEQLSRRRAQAVRRYLVAVHGIEPSRLQAVGLGESAPLAGRGALAPENRRVQFRGE
jgi:outer membrane protein OmpA-like peptidoglycan-associated protein